MEEDNKKITRNGICLNTTHYFSVKRYIASRVKNSDDVEDITQSVFLEFYKKENYCKEYRSPEAYLLKIAQDRVALYYRNRNKQIETISIDSVDKINLSEEALQYYEGSKDSLQWQKHKILQELINQLPPKIRKAMRLRFLHRLSPKDAAKKSGCSVNAFYQRIARGIEAIKKLKDKNNPAR